MTRFLATFEATGGIVRVYSTDHPPPEPYLFAVDIVGDEGTATIKALSTDRLTPGAWLAVKARLRERGFHTVRWTRRDPVSGLMRPTIVKTGIAPGDPDFNPL